MFLFNPDLGDNFIGRTKEIAFMIEQFRLGQNVLLTAPKRFGKTSLVKEIFSRLKERHFFTAYVNIFTATSVNQLAAEIIEAVLENIGLSDDFRKYINIKTRTIESPKLSELFQSFPYLLEFTEKSVDNYTLLANCIDFIEHFSIRNKKRIVFVFDEFCDYKKFDNGKLTKLFKSKLFKHRNTSYLFTGSYELNMASLFEGMKAPFNRLAKKISLFEIDKGLLFQYFKSKFSNHHIAASDDYIIKILDFTNGHPYYSQLALQEAILYHLINEQLPQVDELIQRIFISEKDYIEKTWEDIATSKQHLKTILAITRNKTGVYSSLRNSNVNIYRSLKTLTGNGTLLINKNKSYRLSDPILNYWIKKDVQRQDIIIGNEGN